MNSILLLSADTPEKLRPTDVDRVMIEAFEQNKFQTFKEWLLSQDLHTRTRQLVEEFTEEDCI